MAEQTKVKALDSAQTANFEPPVKRASQPRNLALLLGLLEKAPAHISEALAKPDRQIPAVTAPEKQAQIRDTEHVSSARPKHRWRFRHAVIAVTFFLAVAIPTTIASLYLGFIAANQYHSSASFSVRSIASAQASDLLGMFAQSSSGSTASDSYVLLDFIMSDKMVQDADDTFDLDTIFAPRGVDYFYGIRSGLPIEEKLKYWRSMVRVDFDHASGIMNLTVNAFTPEDSQNIAGFIIQKSEKLINDLSLTGRNEMLKVAESEVKTSEARLSEARDALRNYRDISQEADPIEGAKLAMRLVSSLEGQLVQLQTEYSTALTQMGPDTPRIRVMRSQIDSLKKQIDQEKQRLGSGTVAKQARTADAALPGVAGRLQQYDKLETQREFAERAYTSSLAALEKARIEANAKQRFLAVFINPTLSELAQYPHRFFNSMLIFLAALLIWSVGVMGYYNIRDRN